MSEKKELKALRLKPSLVKDIEKMAEEQNRNFTNMVETLLMQATAKTH